jgi:hypothetical protein
MTIEKVTGSEREARFTAPQAKDLIAERYKRALNFWR